MLTVCSSSTEADLTTTGALRAEILGATATSTVYDARFSDLIRRASRRVESILDRGTLGIQVYQETLPAFDSPYLVLGRRPVRQVLRFFSATSTSTSDGVATEYLSSEYRLENAEAGILRRIGDVYPWTAMDRGTLAEHPAPNTEQRPYFVEYIAGWTYDGLSTASPGWSTENGTTSTGRTLPEDIELATILLAKDLYQSRTGIQSKTVDDLSITYSVTQTIRREAEDLLAPYRSLQ